MAKPRILRKLLNTTNAPTPTETWRGKPKDMPVRMNPNSNIPWNRPDSWEQKPVTVDPMPILMDAFHNPKTRAELNAYINRQIARMNFAEFCRQAWHTIEPTTTLMWNWHHQLICDIVQGVLEEWEKAQDDPEYVQKIKNVLINVYPGSGKSRLLSVFLNCWMWLRRPGWKAICLSINEDATLRDARAARDVMRSMWYQAFEPEWKIKADQDAISNFGNTATGERISRPQGARIIGLRADCLAAGTPITTEIGDISIDGIHERLQTGFATRVLSFNHKTNSLEYKRVQASRVIPDGSILTITTSNGAVIRCTPDHRFYTEAGYLAAKDLGGGHVLVNQFLEWDTVKTITLPNAVEDVYDIQVEGNRNFFADNILVHNCLIIDDPNDPKEAENKQAREDINDLWEQNLFNRVNDPMRSIRIGVQQRVNAEDWTGHVIKNTGIWSPENPEGWLHVVIPTEFETSRRCVTPWGSDPRTEEGELIHKERMTAEWLQTERRRLRDKYAGIMQQRPTEASGGAIKREWFGFCRLAKGVSALHDEYGNDRPRPAGCHEGDPYVIKPAVHRVGWDLDWIVISVDAAAKKTERGSNWGMLVMAGKEQRRFILDDRSRRGDILEILVVLRDMIRTWRPDKILIEDKAAGPTLITTLRDELLNGNIKDEYGKPIMTILEAIPANGQFDERIDALIPTIAAGAIHLLDGAPWLQDFVEELAGYPHAATDDRLDACAQAVTFLRDSGDGATILPDW